MTITNVYFLPIIFFVLGPSTYLVTYVIAVIKGHVTPVFPYVSDTATFPPEGCLFSQSVNIMAVLNFLFVWIRYHQIKKKCGGELTFSLVLCLNRISYWLGILSSIGTSMVANFQETGILWMHAIGGGLVFTPGLFYVILQTLISLRTTGVVGTQRMYLIRLLLTILGIIVSSIGAVATPLSFLFWHGQDWKKWKPEDGGYVFHIMSTICEWIMLIGYSFYVLTFTAEFQELQIEPAEVVSIVRVISLTNEDVQESGEQRQRQADQDDVRVPTVEEQICQPVVVQTRPFRELYA